jgi:TolA-binding protein
MPKRTTRGPGLLLVLLASWGCGTARPRPPDEQPMTRPARRLPPEPAPDPKRCEHQLGVVRASLVARPRKEQIIELRRLTAACRGMRKVACCRRAAATLRELAIGWHQEAQKTQSPDTFARAEALYRAYLEGFPGEKDSFDLTFRHAEVLHRLERWQRAAEAYNRAARLDPRGRRAQQAAHAAVVCWRNALNVDEEPESRQLAGHRGKRPIPEKQKKMIAAIDTYLELSPAGKERPELLYRKARIFYTHDRYAKAVPVFAEIATRHPTHPLAVHAANLLLDSLNVLKRYLELATWVERLLKDPQLARGDLLTQLHRLRRAFRRRKAEQLRKAGRHRECGERYLEIAREPHPRWAEVVYNAALCFEAAKMSATATAARRALILRKPHDPLAQRALAMLGQTHEAERQDRRAAAAYTDFARKFPGEREAPNLLERAVRLWMRLDEHEQALEGARLFARNYGGRRAYRARAARVMLLVGSTLEKQKRWTEARRHYEGWLKRWSAVGGPELQIWAHARLGIALWRRSCPVEGIRGLCVRRKTRFVRLGVPLARRLVVVRRHAARAKAGRKQLSRVLDLHRLHPGEQGMLARRAVAEARLCQGDALFEELLGISRPAKKSALESYLATRDRALARAREPYEAVAAGRLPGLAVAASARLARIHGALVEDLAGTEEAAGRTRSLAGKARAALEACLRRSRKLKRRSEWTELCVEQLARITACPEIYAR